jgi:hypothetical protein
MARGKTTKIVATLKGMKPVGSGVNKRRIVMPPRFRPVAAANVAETDTELIGYDQAEASDEEDFLPVKQRSPDASNKQQGKKQRRPGLKFRRRVGKPTEKSYFIDVVAMDKKCNRPINPKVTDQYRNESHR